MLYRRLESLGHRVWLACRRGHELEAYAQREGMNFLSLGFSGSFSPGGDWSDAQAMTRLVREEKIDVIHAHRGKDHWAAVAAGLRAGVPVVRTRHVVTRVKDHLFNRWLYGRATAAVISVSKAAEAGFGSMLRSIPNQRVILSAVDSEMFHPSKRSELWRREGLTSGFSGDPLWIGLIGRIQRIKGQKIFLDAASIVARECPEAHLLIAGRGGPEARERYQAFARASGFEGRLRVEGMLPNLPEVMASLDIGVVASLGSEGSSRVTMEYMASGAPVVGTCVGGIPEILRGPGDNLEVEELVKKAAMRSWDSSIKFDPRGDGMDCVECVVTLEKEFGIRLSPEEAVACHSVHQLVNLFDCALKPAKEIGWLVPPGNAQTLAESILNLLRDTSRRAALSLHARAHVELHHNPDRWAAAIEDVYREVIDSRK